MFCDNHVLIPLQLAYILTFALWLLSCTDA